LTCNNVYNEYQSGNCFKLYTSSDSRSCSSYSRGNAKSGCQDACDAQYNTCVGTYAEGCRSNNGRGGGDNYSTATSKCKQQWSDCYAANSGVSGNNHCSSWNRWN